MFGPKYVSIDYWRDTNPAPDGFEPGTFFVHGGAGALKYYSIIIYPNPLELTVDDGVETGACVLPDDYIEYQISYSNPVTDPNEPGYVGDANDVVITDYLPDEVDFVSAYPSGQYDPNGHKYTWDIGLLSPGQGGTLLLKVQVTDTIEPLSEIVNTTELTGDITYLLETEQTRVCCFGGEVIYVDASVNAPDPNGSSWGTAFDNLVGAIAAATICDQIWVAKSENAYKPTTNPANHTATFSLLKGVGLYGGFVGDEDERWQRNWFYNETVLSGVIDSAGNEPNRVDYVVVSDANNVLGVIDGFTIKGGGIAGVYCESSSLLIQHNKITDNVTGIYCFESEQPVIKNNWIYKNENGIYFDNPEDAAVVRNNTIADNANVGVYQHAGTYADISNCIIWGNQGGQLDLDDKYMPTYSCIQDSSEVNPYHNINTNPDFEYPDPNLSDYHLDPCSPCIDAGDPCGNYIGERDIDKHFRVLDGDGDDEKRVDMGADEYCNEGDENDADFNDDDIVDTSDLIEMAELWLTDPGPSSKYDLYADNTIDYIDFSYFAKEWLWMTCEMMQGYEMMEMMMGMGGGGEESMLLDETAMVKEILDWLYEVKNEVDEDTWLDLTATLEEMLKELQDLQQD